MKISHLKTDGSMKMSVFDMAHSVLNHLQGEKEGQVTLEGLTDEQSNGIATLLVSAVGLSTLKEQFNPQRADLKFAENDKERAMSADMGNGQKIVASREEGKQETRIIFSGFKDAIPTRAAQQTMRNFRNVL